MLLYVVLVAALPLALARTCPCPPAPDGPKVCGSDLVTYDSQCHLDCAKPGLSLKQPGPCSAIEERTRRRGCFNERKCWKVSVCGCGEEDKDCMLMCGWNCICGCLGYPRGSMDYRLWVEYHGRRECVKTYEQWRERCGGEEECEASCELDSLKCKCDCLQQAYPAPQRMSNWTACLERDQCRSSTCSECAGAGPFCAERCKKRCRCECAGHLRPQRDLSGEWEECFIGTQTCEQAHEECKKECRDKGCKDKCYMARVDCSCDCRTAEQEEWRLWDECRRKDKCSDETCKECQDTDCRERCRRNCGCRCLGFPADSLDDVQLQKCKLEKGCETERIKCLADCETSKRKDCKLTCNLAFVKCYCECAQSRPTKLPESEERVEIIQHCNFIN